MARHGDTISVNSLILEHPQARSVRLQPSLVTPSTMQLMEQGGRLSRRVVTLGVLVAPAVTAAKRRMNSWRKAFILGVVRLEDERWVRGLQIGCGYLSSIESEMGRDVDVDSVGLRG